MRDTIKIPAEAPKEDIKTATLTAENIRQWTEGKTTRKVIMVSGRKVDIEVS